MHAPSEQNRRDFLKLAAVPLIVPSSVFGPGAPSNRINVAMLGTGRQGMRPNLRQLLRSPDAQVVAVCDVDSWRLGKAVEEVDRHYGKGATGTYEGCRAHRDFREVLDRDDVDAVMISTPDHWHAPMGVLAARAGKHVCIEKPLTTCIAHGRSLCDAVAKAGVVSRTDSEFRTNPIFWRLAQLVRNGRIGQVKRITTGVPRELTGDSLPPQKSTAVPTDLDYDLWLGPAFPAPYAEQRVHPARKWGRPGWLRIEDYCNGMISNWGSHLNDIAQWANGTDLTGPVSVKGTGEFAKGLWNTIIRFEVEYEFASGVQLRYGIDRPYVRIEGTDGWLQAEYGKKLTASSPKILEAKPDPGELDFSRTLADKTDFLSAIKNGGETLEPAEVGHRTVSLCQIGLISIKLGRPLRWDPDWERFLDDNAANAMLTRPVRQPWII